MKPKSKFIQFFHNLWYVETEVPNKDEFYNYDGTFNEGYYNRICESYKESALKQQREKRATIIGIVVGLLLAVLLFFYLFQILLCIGLFLGCVGMLLKL